MKKSKIFIALLFVITAFPLFCSEKVDLIVLLDNSVSVLPFYGDIRESLIERIISEHLEPGDSFSLITFSDVPEVEISKEIRSRDDIENILAYSALLQPMGNHTDLIMALRFLYQFSLDLPLNNKKKIVILTDGIHDPPQDSPYYYDEPEKVRGEIRKAADEIHREGLDVSIVTLGSQDDNGAGQTQESSGSGDLTDTAAGEPSGVNESPGTSSVAATAKAEQPQAAAAATDEDRPASPDSQAVNVLDTVTGVLDDKPENFNPDVDMAGIALGVPDITIPEHLGEISGKKIRLPLTILNRSSDTVMFSLSGMTNNGVNYLIEKKSIEIAPRSREILNTELRLPDEISEGEQSVELKFVLLGGLRVNPGRVTVNFYYAEPSGIITRLSFLTDWKFITIIAAVILAVIIIFIIKKASASGATAAATYTAAPETTVVTGGGPVHHPQGVETKKTEPVSEKTEEIFMVAQETSDGMVDHQKKNRPIQMLVYGQNTKTGISNVRWLGLKTRRPIGSSPSAVFRIFLVKVPSVIAYIECTGEDFIFYPEIKEMFPEIDGPVRSCLGLPIKVRTEDKKVFYIEFRQWISELEKVNRILGMTRKAGKPDFDY